MSFMDELKNTLDDKYNYSMTENGALGYRTTTHPLLDLNFAVSSLRSVSEEKITQMFRSAFVDDPRSAIKWLFYARDIRGGLGERRLFRIIINDMARTYPDLARKVLYLIPVYGRYDDMWDLLDTDLRSDVITMIANVLKFDEAQMELGRPVTLLAKWLPSVASGTKARDLALTISSELRLTENKYRRKLSKLRKYIGIVETKMCAGDWSSIDYSKVPSRAALIYKGAFSKHDAERYAEYLESVTKGEAKINAGALVPHDIVAKYVRSDYVSVPKDTTLEELWKALPKVDLSGKRMLVVRDGSYSMTDTAGNTKVSCLTIATALTVYFSERTEGEFKDKFITFSSRPALIDLSKQSNLHDKLVKCYSHFDCSNTDIQAVFELILRTATAAKMSQADLPENILIFSDMEFDGHRFHWSERLFSSIAEQYEEAGYKLPRLIFWNLNSRTQTIPMIKNELGLVLTSGFSQNSAKMIMSGELDPMKALLEVINSERYAEIDKALGE